MTSSGVARLLSHFSDRAAVSALATLLAWAMAGSSAAADQIWPASDAIPSDTPAGSTRAELVSADGRYVVLSSTSTGWLPGLGDLNGGWHGGPDIYLWDRIAGTYALV